jgi:hypothetical protein
MVMAFLLILLGAASGVMALATVTESVFGDGTWVAPVVFVASLPVLGLLRFLGRLLVRVLYLPVLVAGEGEPYALTAYRLSLRLTRDGNDRRLVVRLVPGMLLWAVLSVLTVGILFFLWTLPLLLVGWVTMTRQALERWEAEWPPKPADGRPACVDETDPPRYD